MKAVKWSSILVLILVTVSVNAQEQVQQERNEYVMQARLIKIKRMSEAWENEPVKLLLFGGTFDQGRFLSIHDNAFRLKTGSAIKEIPVLDVKSIVLKRKPQNLLFVGIASVGVAALFAGGASLGFDASKQEMIGASSAGAVIGFMVGWKAFYQNIVIPLY